MADAIPVTAPDEASVEAPKEEVKKTAKGKKVVSEEVLAELAGTAQEDAGYRTKGGKKLANHEAVREDF